MICKQQMKTSARNVHLSVVVKSFLILCSISWKKITCPCQKVQKMRCNYTSLYQQNCDQFCSCDSYFNETFGFKILLPSHSVEFPVLSNKLAINVAPYTTTANSKQRNRMLRSKTLTFSITSFATWSKWCQLCLQPPGTICDMVNEQ